MPSHIITSTTNSAGSTIVSTIATTVTIPGAADTGAANSSSNHSSSNTGAIVGGVVGGVAGVIALGLLGFYLIRRRQDSSLISHITALDEEHKNASNIAPYTFGVPGAPSSVAPSSAFGAFASPPISPHAPLLEHDAVHGAAPPTYEEASEAGGSATSPGPRASGFPSEKGGYRRDTTMTMSGYDSAPVSPNNQSTFGGSSHSAT